MTLTDHRESSDGQLAPSLEHELRTALSMIVGFAELLETREDPDTRTEAAHGITMAAARLQATIESITGGRLDPPLDNAVHQANTNGACRLMAIVDEPGALELLRATFSRESFDMLEVRDPDEGFDLLDEVNPDLIILDWKLAGGGAETLAELKLRNPHLPVIVLADDGDPKQRQIAALLDADEFLTRPVSTVELLNLAHLRTGHPPA
jgi:CheY-like chemotaxis protein